MQLPGETLLTGSMVNNYVKQGVIPAPHKKRYTRRHLASLLFVCAFKRVFFSIAQVKQLMERIYASGVDLAWLYDEACALLEPLACRVLPRPCSTTSPFDPAIGEPCGEKDLDPELARLIEASVASLRPPRSTWSRRCCSAAGGASA